MDNPLDSLILVQEPESPYAEAFRSIRVTLSRSLAPGRSKLLFTSPWVDDGKSYVSANVALAFAQTGRSVLLLDGDLRRPTLSSVFDAMQAPGFSDAVERRIAMREAVMPTSMNGLQFLPAGISTTHPSNLLASDAARQVLLEANVLAECVIMDSPPLSVCSDGFMLGALADGVVLVINARNWKGDPELKWKQRLEESGATVLGVILNQVERGEDSAGYYSYYDQYYYGGYSYSSYSVHRDKAEEKR
ncbi:MAG: CpsD/CapB family tyrosine-protein kinase [Candidatus Xenobia bacterium]